MTAPPPPRPHPEAPLRPPSASPHGPAPATSRGYGWIVLGGALVWAALTVLVVLSAWAALWAILIGIGEVTTPTPDGARRVDEAMAVGLATGVAALALLLCALALDLVTTIASIRRLDGRRGDRVVPVIALAAVTICLVLPVGLALLAVAASLVDLTQLTAALIWLVMAVVLTLVPLARTAQAVAGLIRLITGEPAAS